MRVCCWGGQTGFPSWTCLGVSCSCQPGEREVLAFRPWKGTEGPPHPPPLHASRGLPAPGLPQSPTPVFGNHTVTPSRVQNRPPAPGSLLGEHPGSLRTQARTLLWFSPDPSGADLPPSSRELSHEQPGAEKQVCPPPVPTPRAGALGPGDRAELPSSAVTPASQLCLPGPQFLYL